MKKYFLLSFLLFSIIAGFAQNISVKSFRPLPNDLSPTSHKRTDQNGEVAALIKVVTNETGFVFEGGALGIVDTKQEVSEVWVWVPRGLRKITIKHPRLGQLRDYYFPVEIESERAYEMVLTTKVLTPFGVQEQFLVFTVTPKDAVVTVNGTPWPMNEGVAQKMVPFGDYEYRIEALDYHTEAGRVKVDDPEKKVTVNVTLQPAFGFLKLMGDNSLLSQASIYVDNANASMALTGSMKLASGNHTLKIIHPKYKPYERVVTITDGQTNTTNVNLDANFSTITLTVDDDAEIWVNNEKKGVRSWTGDLEAGNYAIECRKPNHRSSTVRKTVTDNMSGQTIQLQAPTPINGTLVVNSNPPMAKIVIDGRQVGETPQRINAILIGEHTLRLEKQGCAPVSKTIVIEEGKTLSLEEKLDTGRSVMVKTDRKGDKIYVDGDYVGETPYETPLSFGNHTIKVMRNGVGVPKTINISENSFNGQELVFEFGKMITIKTDQDGDEVMVDGSVVGNSPVRIDLPFGSHTIHAQRDNNKYADKTIVVLKEGGETSHTLILHSESAIDFVKHGVNFVTLDFAYSPAPQTSFGATFGSVKTLGWFVTAASNFNFDAMKYSDVADANGLVDGSYYYDYTGESCSTRISAMAGVLVKLGCPLYLKVGAGYGCRMKSWYTTDGKIVKVDNDSFSGIDATAGLLLNLKGFTISLDAVTTSFKTIEAKVCLGYCWKMK